MNAKQVLTSQRLPSNMRQVLQKLDQGDGRLVSYRRYQEV